MASKGRRTARQKAAGADLLAEELAYAAEGRLTLHGTRDSRVGPGKQDHTRPRPFKTGVGCTVAALDYADSRARRAVKGTAANPQATATGGRRLPCAGE